MKSLLQQRIIIVVGLVFIAVLLAITTGRTKPLSKDIDMAVLNHQQTIVVCPQGLPSCHFARIQDAIDAAPEGTIIVIKSGTYEENLIIRKSLAIQAAEGEQVVVKSAMESLPTLLLVNGRPIHVEVRGLTIQPARQHRGNGIEIMGMVAARIERTTIHDYEWGIFILGKIGSALSELPVIIRENTIHSSIGMRQSTTVAVSQNVIQRNEAHEPVGIAIDDSGDILVSENLIEGGGGVWVSQSFVNMMTRNIIRKNAVGIYIEGSKVFELSDNQIEQNGVGVAVASRWQGGMNSLVIHLTGNRITQQELYGLVVERVDYIAECQGNQIRDNKQSNYRVQSPIISFFGEPKRDLAAEEKLRQQCEGG